MAEKTGIDPYPCQFIASIMESEHEEKRGEKSRCSVKWQLL